MTKRRPGRAGAGFYEAFRSTLAAWPDGVHRAGSPAQGADLVSAAAALGRPLPRELLDFLGSWNGALVFHESVALFGVGEKAEGGDLVRATRGAVAAGACAPGEIVVGETGDGGLCALAEDGRVWLVEDDERWPVGSSLERFVAAVCAHEAVLFDRDGEYREGAFEPGGERLVPALAAAAAKRAIAADPVAARWHFELGVALAGTQPEQAARALAEAGRLFPEGPFVHHELGKLQAKRGRAADAAAAFEAAFDADPEHASAAFFLLEAARAARQAGQDARADALGRRALTLDGGIAARLREAAEQQLEDGQKDAAAELVALARQAAPRDLQLLALARRLA